MSSYVIMSNNENIEIVPPVTFSFAVIQGSPTFDGEMRVRRSLSPVFFICSTVYTFSPTTST